MLKLVSLFGFLSLALLPITLVFIRYGSLLRQRSRYAREADEIIQRMRGAQGNVKAETKIETKRDVENGGIEGSQLEEDLETVLGIGTDKS